MDTSPLFTDLESIIKAASKDAETICDKELIPENNSSSEKNPETLDVSKMPSMSELMNHIGTLDTNELTRIMGESLNNVSPEMIDQARRLATGGQAEQIMKEMNRRGVNPQALRSDLLRQRNALRGMNTKKPGVTKRVLYITRSRQIKERDIPIHDMNASINAILRVSNPIELSCSRLAKGPLTGHTIKLWYDPNESGKNRLSSKLIGFPIGGEAVIISETDDLTEASLIQAMNHLS
jgi:hypothetical protein